MHPNRRPSGLRPFEFRLTFKDKKRLRQLSANAGVSMSDYVRRSIDSCAEEIKLRELIEHLGEQPFEAEAQG
jgi:predicted DNA-binding protein